MRKKMMFIITSLAFSLGANAQGSNIGMGGSDGDVVSLAERVAKLEKKSDAFNLYFNYAASFQAEHNGLTNDRTSRFGNKQLRIEIKGNLTDRLYYRFRHRLNKSTAAKSDNFAKATDIMMVGYRLTDKLNVQGGKMCLIWGGFEFDENPIRIYQYSDFVDNMDSFMAGAIVSYKPTPSHEIAVQVSNANNGNLVDDYGEGAKSYEGNGKYRVLEQANHPLTYAVSWNGSLFDNKLQTRWSWGIQTLAKKKYSRMLVLGQQLNLPNLQWYLDYMGAYEGLDRLRIATSELGATKLKDNAYFSDVIHHSFITKANWQFAPKCNLMLKAMYETVSVSKVEELKNYRKSYGYMASVEYYPVEHQDFRVSLAYIGCKFDYSSKCGLRSFNTDRIELGFMYRLKMY